MKNKWDERYSNEEYIYGTEPNGFYSDELKNLNPGKILFLGEGEGRNAVHAAKMGWRVDAVDSSSVGRNKALKLAEQNNVSINYIVADLKEYSFQKNMYDAVVLIFLHLPEELREIVHSSVVNTLKPGGALIMEAFEKEQIKYNSGGPKNIDLLYSLEDIYNDFHELDITTFNKETLHIFEGPHHRGESVVVRFVGTKM